MGLATRCARRRSSGRARRIASGSQRPRCAPRRQRGRNSGRCRRRKKSRCGPARFAATCARTNCRQAHAALAARLWAAPRAGGDASKLAGRLSWGCAYMFNRLGRALLRRGAAPGVAVTRRPDFALLVAGRCSRGPTVAPTGSTSHSGWPCGGGWTRSSATYPKRAAGTRRGAPRGRSHAAARSASPGRAALCRDIRRRERGASPPRGGALHRWRDSVHKSPRDR